MEVVEMSKEEYPVAEHGWTMAIEVYWTPLDHSLHGTDGN
jgi:hypothetical protein